MKTVGRLPDARVSVNPMAGAGATAKKWPRIMALLPRLTHSKVAMKRAREVEVQSASQMLLQADGEFLGEAPARFHVLPVALNVII